MSWFRRSGAEILRVRRRIADPAAALTEIQVYAKDAAGITQLFARDSAGSIYQLTPPAVTPAFGLNFQSVLVAGRTTTTGAIFFTKASLVTPALTGTFRVMATANIDSILSMQGRLQNVTDAVQVGDTGEYTPLLSADSVAWVAAGNVVFAGAAKTFEIQWRDTPPGGQTAGISDARIEFWRIA